MRYIFWAVQILAAISWNGLALWAHHLTTHGNLVAGFAIIGVTSVILGSTAGTSIAVGYFKHRDRVRYARNMAAAQEWVNQRHG